MANLLQNQYFLGAQHDLNSIVKQHLFVIAPNNSGSTFLRKSLEKCKRTWSLEREGQHTMGFAGVNTIDSGMQLLWASRADWIAEFRNKAAFDWQKSKHYWYFQARSFSSDASVFVTSSPPFLLNVAELRTHFEGARFIFLVRNPYAVVEGIYRWHKPASRQRDELLTTAARHIITCMTYQRQNIEEHLDLGVFFTYEDMCKYPSDITEQITAKFPELDDHQFDHQIPVKGIYNEKLRDMNSQQISRLSARDIDRINEVFSISDHILSHFGYELL